MNAIEQIEKFKEKYPSYAKVSNHLRLLFDENVMTRRDCCSKAKNLVNDMSIKINAAIMIYNYNEEITSCPSDNDRHVIGNINDFTTQIRTDLLTLISMKDHKQLEEAIKDTASLLYELRLAGDYEFYLVVGSLIVDIRMDKSDSDKSSFGNSRELERTPQVDKILVVIPTGREIDFVEYINILEMPIENVEISFIGSLNSPEKRNEYTKAIRAKESRDLAVERITDDYQLHRKIQSIDIDRLLYNDIKKLKENHIEYLNDLIKEKILERSRSNDNGRGR